MEHLTEEQVAALVESRQENLERFLNAEGYQPVCWDDEADAFEVQGDSQVVEWILVVRHHDFNSEYDSYSVLNSRRMPPHSKLGLLQMAAGEVFD